MPRGSSNSCKWNQIRRILILVLDAPSVFYFILFFLDEMEALVSFVLFFYGREAFSRSIQFLLSSKIILLP